MGLIRVDTDAVAQVAVNVGSLSRTFDGVAGRVTAAQSELADSVSGHENIGTELSAVGKRLKIQLEQMGKLEKLLYTVNDSFSEADNRIGKESNAVKYQMDRVAEGMVAPTVSRTSLGMMETLAAIAVVDKAFGKKAGVLTWWKKFWDWLTGQNKKEEVSGVVIDVTNQRPDGKPNYVKFLYSKDDVGITVTDFSGYNRYNKSHQCVGYAMDRADEKLGINSSEVFKLLGYSGDAIDMPKNAEDALAKGNLIDPADEKAYRILNDQYKVKAYTDDDGTAIVSNSWVSFSAKDSTGGPGHVVFVESVQVESDGKFVYYSEGNTSKSGTLKRLPFEEFMSLGGRNYSGCVTFEAIN